MRLFQYAFASIVCIGTITVGWAADDKPRAHVEAAVVAEEDTVPKKRAVEREVPGVTHQPRTSNDPHAAVFAESEYPSASECSNCHQTIYDEWSSSSHAYASISPVFHKFEQKINNLASGTIGYFCMRCHASVGTTMNERRDLPITQRVPVAREGITCVSCHRVSEGYGRVNGERRMEPGNIHAPVIGSGDGAGLKDVVDNKEQYRVKTSPSDAGPGQNIHASQIKFEQLSKSEFCVSCHQVAVHPGIKLEVVWEQYRASPAKKEGVSCQDCHMGKTPGVNDGYATGPAAIVAGQPINPTRKRTNHAFYGPGYPIAHPGIFPHNPKAERWSVDQWLRFDWRAGWGTEAFEDKLTAAQRRTGFPEEWSEPDDRMEARDVIEENLAKLRRKAETRKQVMENGSHIDGPFFNGDPRAGQSLSFHYRVQNTNGGHNMPSGSLGAQPELWLNVALIDPSGKNVWESGYLDSNGDMADEHSLDVRAGKTKYDSQLFNLQTKFLITNVKGTDREIYLPINIDIDQLPFIRPAANPVSVMNHPPFARMEGRSIPPLGYRDAKYSIPGELLRQPGTYKLAVRMRTRAEPIYFMRFIGATQEMERMMNEWMVDIHPYTVEFTVR